MHSASWKVFLLAAGLLAGAVSLADGKRCLEAIIEANRFTVNRDLRDYACMMSGQKGKLSIDGPSVFLDDAEKLTEAQHWMDMGAGEVYAQERFARKFSLPRRAPRLTAVTYEMIRDLSWDVAGLIRVHKGRFVENIPAGELGRADLITDVYGPMTYSAAPDVVLRRYLELLKDDGTLYIFFGPDFDYGRATVTVGARTMTLMEFVETHVGGVTVERVENQYNGLKVRPDDWMRTDLTADCVTLRIRRNGKPAFVPSLTLTGNEDGSAHAPIPFRHFSQAN